MLHWYLEKNLKILENLQNGTVKKRKEWNKEWWKVKGISKTQNKKSDFFFYKAGNLYFHLNSNKKKISTNIQNVQMNVFETTVTVHCDKSF